MLTTVKLKSKAAKLQLYMGMHGRIRMGSESQSALQRLPVRSVIGSIKAAPAYAGAVIPARMRRCWPAAAIAAQTCRTHTTLSGCVSSAGVCSCVAQTLQAQFLALSIACAATLALWATRFHDVLDGDPHVALPHLTSHCMQAWPSGCCGCESQQWAGPDAGALPPASCAPAARAHTAWGRSGPCLQSSHSLG